MSAWSYRRRPPAVHDERGFTLIELMISVAVMGIIVTIIAQVLFYQQRAFINQLAYSEAQQNGRASAALLKRYVRVGGYGAWARETAIGAAPVGACYSDTQSDQQQFVCDGVDVDRNGITFSTPGGGTDRLRVNYIQPSDGAGTFGQGHQSTAGDPNNLAIGTLADPAPAGHPLAAGVLGLVSGPCIGGIPASHGADLVRITSTGVAAASHFEYQYTAIESGGVGLACTNGYETGFNFGEAVVADFYIDRTDTDHPVLRLRLDPSLPLTDGYVVAHDIDDLQVRFMLDTSDATGPDPDGLWDELCDRLTSDSVVDGGCPTALSAAERLARVTGVRLAVVPRTREYREKLDSGGAPLTVQNHIFTGKNDGYRRWIYRATVALRNNEI